MFRLPRVNTEDLPIDIDRLKSVGLYQASYISTDQISFNQWAKKACEKNACGMYDTNWACPPASGTIDECKEKINSYNHAFVFNGKYSLKRETDFRSMKKGMEEFNDSVYKLDNLLKENLSDYLLFSVGECSYCKNCAYPDECRFPEKVFPAVEGLGIDVTRLSVTAGISYAEDPLSIIYLGMVVYND